MKEFIAEVLISAHNGRLKKTQIEVLARSEEEAEKRLLKLGVNEVYSLKPFTRKNPALPGSKPISSKPFTYYPKSYAIKGI